MNKNKAIFSYLILNPYLLLIQIYNCVYELKIAIKIKKDCFTTALIDLW